MSMRAMLLLSMITGPVLAGSESPPEGPPWVRDLAVARKKALAGGKPIFIYFTKTY